MVRSPLSMVGVLGDVVGPVFGLVEDDELGPVVGVWLGAMFSTAPFKMFATSSFFFVSAFGGRFGLFLGGVGEGVGEGVGVASSVTLGVGVGVAEALGVGVFFGVGVGVEAGVGVGVGVAVGVGVGVGVGLPPPPPPPPPPAPPPPALEVLKF